MEKGFIVALIFAIIVGIFSLANNSIVMIDFIFTSFQVSQALVILLSTLLGAIIVFTFNFYKTFLLKQKIKNLNKEISQLKSENEMMKNLETSRLEAGQPDIIDEDLEEIEEGLVVDEVQASSENKEDKNKENM